MRPLTPAETAVLDALRAGFGNTITREELADDSERGLWVSFELAGHAHPTQVSVGHLARMVEAGRPVEAVVNAVVAGPPPLTLLARLDPLPVVTLATFRRWVALAVGAGLAVGLIGGFLVGRFVR